MLFFVIFCLLIFTGMFLIWYNNIQGSRQVMAEQHILASFRDIINNQTTSTQLAHLHSSHPYWHHITHQMPQLTPAQIRNLTKTQEQKIVQRIVPHCTQQLYEEISQICPEVNDLTTISTQEVTTRLQLMSTKLILIERPTCDSESEESWEHQKSQTFFGDVRFDMALMESEEQPEEVQPHTMRNIFEEVEQHGAWNHHQYFGLS